MSDKEVETNKFELDTKKYEIEKSYLSKEEFINIINNIDFIGVKRCEIGLITGFIIDCENNDIKPLTKNIEID